MKSITSIIIAGILISGISSCRKHLIQGEGSIITETRNLSSFSSVNLDGHAQVEVYQSNINKVEVTGYENLVPVFETFVSGNKLTLRFEDKFVNVRGNNIKVKVYSTSVGKVTVNGSGDIHIGDSLNTEDMQTEINGSGNIYFGNNRFSTLELHISGSGDINAKSAMASDVKAEVSGSGNITTRPLYKLDAEIDGSGDIYYYSTPEILNVKISGSGKVQKS
jgi:hypothetical protein